MRVANQCRKEVSSIQPSIYSPQSLSTLKTRFKYALLQQKKRPNLSHFLPNNFESSFFAPSIEQLGGNIRYLGHLHSETRAMEGESQLKRSLFIPKPTPNNYPTPISRIILFKKLGFKVIFSFSSFIMIR